jgi:hypothetical protein
MQKLISLLSFALFANSVNAQALEAGEETSKPAPVVDSYNIERKLGEERQISERQRYFWSQRGLELGRVASKAYDYSNLRAAAVAQLASEPASRAAGSWTSLGPAGMTMFSWQISPVNGRVAAFAQSPASTSNLMVGGASGGLWRSINGGSSWTPVFENIGTQTIGSIWYEPGNASRVWVGTGERNNSCVDYFGQGLFLSTDGGVSFTARNGGGSLNLSHITSISSSPSPSATVLVSGTSFCNSGSQQSGGIFRSTDSGASWTKVAVGAAEDVSFLRSDGTVAYGAISGNGVVKSTNSGQSWSRLSSGLPTVNVSIAGLGNVTSIGTVRIATVPYDSRMVYASYRFSYLPAGAQSSLTRTDLFRTVNSGASWSLVKANVCDGQCDYNVTIDIDPIAPADPSKPVIALGFVRPWLSTDGGSTFNPITNTWGSSQQVHQDIHVVRFARLNVGPFPATTPLWIGSDGGLWRTDNRGSSYTNLNNGLSMTQFYDIAVHPSTLNAVFGGTQDNSSVGRFGSNLWSVTVANGDGGTTLVDTGNPNIVFQFGYTPFNNQGPTVPSMWRSDQGGAAGSFSQVSTSGLVVGEPFSFIAKGASASGFVFLGSSSIYRASSNVAAGSVSWTKISNNLTQGSAISVITPARKLATDPLTLYVGDVGGRIWRLFNVTATNTPASANVTNNFPTGTIVTDIAVDPSNLSRIFAVRGGFGGSKLYYSGDQAATWVARGGGLPDVPVNSVAVDPADGAKIFVATDVGVFRSFDGGVSFQSYQAGMPLGAVATDLEIQGSTRKLYVATYGRGVYVIDL